MDVETPRWRRLDPDARKGQILRCATRLFGERPYSAVSVNDIAEEVGVARGLINHYFGNKRDLYLAVVRYMVTVPPLEEVHLPSGSTRKRAESTVDWLLTAIEAQGTAWAAVTGAEGVASDPEVERILDEADDLAAERVLQTFDLADVVEHRAETIAMIRCFGSMVKAASREWLTRGVLNREQVHALLTESLTALMVKALPRASAAARN